MICAYECIVCPLETPPYGFFCSKGVETGNEYYLTLHCVINFSIELPDCSPSIPPIVIRSGPNYDQARFPPEKIFESDECEVISVDKTCPICLIYLMLDRDENVSSRHENRLDFKKRVSAHSYMYRLTRLVTGWAPTDRVPVSLWIWAVLSWSDL